MRVGIVLGVLLIGLAACASTSTHQLKHSAMDPEWSGEPFQRILIVGLEERKYRIPFEDTFANELRSRGFDAVASYRTVPDPANLDDPAEVEALLADSGVDAVLTVRASGLREANNQAWGVAYVAAWLMTTRRAEICAGLLVQARLSTTWMRPTMA